MMKVNMKEGNTEGRNDRTDGSHILPFKINNNLIINGPDPCTEQIHMISTEHMQIHKCIKLHYTRDLQKVSALLYFRGKR